MAERRVPRGRVRLRPTRAGVAACCMLVACLLHAWLTGAEAVTGFAGALLASVVVVGAVLARRNAAGLEVHGGGVVHATAGEVFGVEARLVSRKRGASRDLHLAVRGSDAEPVRRGAFQVDAVAGGEHRRAVIRHREKQRGFYESLRVVLTSTYPFGLFRARVDCELPVELWVLPRLGQLSRNVDPPASGSSRPLPTRHRRRPDPCADEEFERLREHRAGEPLRRVHWPRSVLRGRPLLREYGEVRRPPVDVVLSTFVPRPEGPDRDEAFEQAVSLCGTLLVHFLRAGHATRLVVCGPQVVEVEPRVRGTRAPLSLLTHLARVVPERAPVVDARAPGGTRKAARIYVSAGGDGTGEPAAIAWSGGLAPELHLDVGRPGLLRSVYRSARGPGGARPERRSG